MNEKVCCDNCIYSRSYYADEYDSDAWCIKDKPQFRVMELTICDDFKERDSNG